MKKVKILWTDDEIDLLKPHILFLEEKGYDVDTATNGDDAIEMVERKIYDIIFLDENMPGLSGLETLNHIRAVHPDIPLVMITKSEEEDFMDEAIGSKIDDFLIKPVNPKQILLSIKKHLDNRRLVSEKAISDYQSEFGKISILIGEAISLDDWKNIYRRLVFWQSELDNQFDIGLSEVLAAQFTEANNEFGKFIEKNYKHWISSDEKILLSHRLMQDKVIPLIDKGVNVFLLVIDNLRYDQWKLIHPIISDFYKIDEEILYCSILPTATQYARNSIFSGLLPSEIEKQFPQYWVHDEEEEGKNMYEKELLTQMLERYHKDYTCYYEKVNNSKVGEHVVKNLNQIIENKLNVIVYNYIDMLSHVRTEMDVLKELAKDEAAFRSLTLSWFKHSPLFDLLKELSSRNSTVIITTDHGNIRVQNPLKVIGDRNTSTNIRYKVGKNLKYPEKNVLSVLKPEEFSLPKSNLSSTYIFARNNDFFAYPKNYNYFVNYYKDTFQHGGISMEEMLIPFVVLRPNI